MYERDIIFLVNIITTVTDGMLLYGTLQEKNEE
jgi:hypothetical protein